MSESKVTTHRVTMPEDMALEYLDKLLFLVNKQFFDPGFPIALSMAIDALRCAPIAGRDFVGEDRYNALLRRFRHLLKSKFISSFDEWNPCNCMYKRDIAEADAIALDRRAPLPDNKSLTVEELREMVGAWVWATVQYKHGKRDGWDFVATPAYIGFLEQTIPIDFCGRKFVAYRRPPEKGE